MKQSTFIILSMTAFLVLCFGNDVIAQGGYKGIIPMLSNCDDVRNILEAARCGNAEQFFKLPDETLKIVYTTKECDEFFGKKWNVPIGTVVSVRRIFRTPPTWQKLGLTIDESEFTKHYTDVIGQVIYERKKGGLTIGTTGEHISSIEYTPVEEDYSKTWSSSPKDLNRSLLPSERPVSKTDRRIVPMKSTLKGCKKDPIN